MDKTILVVDDEPAIRKLLSVVLGREGFRVHLAADGREAVELFRAHGQVIDAVLLDVSMPGLDGLQTLAALRRLDPDVRCLLMSGEYLPGLRASGARGVLAKPFENLSQLRRAIGDVVATPPTTGHPRAGSEAATPRRGLFALLPGRN